MALSATSSPRKKTGINTPGIDVMKKRGLYIRTTETGRKVFWVRSFAAINKEIIY